MNFTPLGDVVEINPSHQDHHADLDDECSFIPMDCINEIEGKITRFHKRMIRDMDKGYTPFQENDVLFAKITPCMENGKVAIARGLINGIGFGSTEYHVLRAKKQVLAEWVYYFLRQETVRKEATQWFRGTAGQQRVPEDFLHQALISIPSRDEQQRIIQVLKKADWLRHLRRYDRSLRNVYLQSLFLENFGDPIINPYRWEKGPISAVLVNEKDGIRTGPFGSSLK
jgi:type I restriction enzyme, S subunit